MFFRTLASIRFCSVLACPVSIFLGLVFFGLFFPGIAKSFEEPGARAEESKIQENQGAEAEQITGLWGELLGGGGSQGDMGQTKGYDFSSAGFILGYDKGLNDAIRFGASAGYLRVDLDSSDAQSGQEADTHTIGVYGSYDGAHDDFLPFYIDVAMTYSRGDIQLFRDGGTIGNTHSNSMTLSGEYGVATPCPKAFSLAPVVGLQSTVVFIDGYVEHGPGALEIADSKNYFFSSTLGLRATYDEKYVAASAWLLWSHEFSSDIKSAAERRPAGTDSPFESVRGVYGGADRTVSGASVTVRMAGAHSMTLSYGAEWGDQYLSYSWDVMIQYAF